MILFAAHLLHPKQLTMVHITLLFPFPILNLILLLFLEIMKNLVLCFDRSAATSSSSVISTSSSSSPPSSSASSSTSNYSPLPAYITANPPPASSASSSSQPTVIPVNPISISTSAIVSPRSQQQPPLPSPKLSASQPVAQNPPGAAAKESGSTISNSALSNALSPRKQIVFRGEST